MALKCVYILENQKNRNVFYVFTTVPLISPSCPVFIATNLLYVKMFLSEKYDCIKNKIRY